MTTPEILPAKARKVGTFPALPQADEPWPGWYAYAHALDHQADPQDRKS